MLLVWGTTAKSWEPVAEVWNKKTLGRPTWENVKKWAETKGLLWAVLEENGNPLQRVGAVA